MNQRKIADWRSDRFRSFAFLLLLVPAIASAQMVVSEDFTCPPSQVNGSTGCQISNKWTAINGACLTAGPGSQGNIPSCVGLPYYANKGDSFQVGGYNGYLGDSSPPSSNATQSPDPQGYGALRLTNGYPYLYENGAIVSYNPFSAGEGVQVTFKTITYRGNRGGGGGDGADGMSFFLLDASKYQAGSKVLGALGGSLGYSCSNGNTPYDGQTGYMGLGIDEYGNFLNRYDNTATGVPATAGGSGDYQWNRIGLRGAGNVSWAWLNSNFPSEYPSTFAQYQRDIAVQETCSSGKTIGTSTPVADYAPIPGANTVLSGVTIANEGATTRSQATPIDYVLKITPDGLLSLSYSVNGGALTEVLANQSITSNNGSLPSQLLFGFAGSTGGSDNIHEILCFSAGPAQQSAASAAVNLPQNELTTGAQVYLPAYHQEDWWGQLTAQLINVSGGLVTFGAVQWDASCVLTGGPCMSMQNSPSVGAEGPSSRTILSWNPAGGSNGSGVGVSFQWGSLSTAEKNALNPSAASSSTSPRLEYLRGDRSNEVPTTGPTGTQIYRDRTGVLGDIIHSSPAWVGPPNGGVAGVGSYANFWTDRLYPSAGSAENTASSTNNYSAFSSQYAGRENVVYVGANDGMLHGFRSGSLDSSGNLVTTTYPDDGYEVLAYMPATVVQQIHSIAATYDYSNPGYSHIFGVDASPATGDLFYGGAWHTWAVGGLGAGGSAIYALDVTDPTTFSEAGAASLVQGEWTPSTIHCSTSSGNSLWNCGQHLGNTYGKPAIWRFHAENTGGDDMWGVVFGNGFPNRITGSISQSSGGTATLTVAQGTGITVGQTVFGSGVPAGMTIVAQTSGPTGGIGTYTVSGSLSSAIAPEALYTEGSSAGTAGIYVMLVDPVTGAKSFAYLDTGYGPSQDPLHQGRPDGIAYVTPVDLDGDNTVDYVYAGDLFGNVWRFNLTSKSASSWHASTYGTAFATPLFRTPTQAINGALVGQPITSAIAPTMITMPSGQSGVLLVFGTGQEIPFTPISQASFAAGPQSVYGVWDWDMAGWNAMSGMTLASASGAIPEPLTSFDLATQTVTVTNGGGSSGGYETISSPSSVCWYGATNCANNGQFGWQVGLPNSGEEILYSPTVTQGIMMINTVIPSSSTPFSCTFIYPTGYTMFLDPATGGPFFTTTSSATSAQTSAILGANGSPLMAGTLGVVGLQTGGTGSVAVFKATINGTMGTYWMTGTAQGGAGFNLGVGGTGSGSGGTGGSGGSGSGGTSIGNGSGLNVPAAPVSAHRVTWTELR